jgi:hypothetical protein
VVDEVNLLLFPGATFRGQWDFVDTACLIITEVILRVLRRQGPGVVVGRHHPLQVELRWRARSDDLEEWLVLLRKKYSNSTPLDED